MIKIQEDFPPPYFDFKTGRYLNREYYAKESFKKLLKSTIIHRIQKLEERISELEEKNNYFFLNKPPKKEAKAEPNLETTPTEYFL